MLWAAATTSQHSQRHLPRIPTFILSMLASIFSCSTSLRACAMLAVLLLAMGRPGGLPGRAAGRNTPGSAAGLLPAPRGWAGLARVECQSHQNDRVRVGDANPGQGHRARVVPRAGMPLRWHWDCPELRLQPKAELCFGVCCSLKACDSNKTQDFCARLIPCPSSSPCWCPVCVQCPLASLPLSLLPICTLRR